MKSYFLTVLLLNYLGVLVAQDPTPYAKTDTIFTPSFQVTPYFQQEVKDAGIYIKTINNNELLRFSSGVSIFNALRGQLPGLAIPAYFSSTQFLGMRTGPYGYVRDALVVIDGLPFNNSIENYQNLNAFDFSSISIFSNESSPAIAGVLHRQLWCQLKLIELN